MARFKHHVMNIMFAGSDRGTVIGRILNHQYLDDPGEVEEYAKARQTLELSDSLEELQSTWIAGQRSWNEDFDEQSMKILTAIKDMRKQSLQNASSKEDE